MDPVKTSLKTTETWNAIPWTKVQRKVFKLQQRIFQAAKSGQDAKARRLQKLLTSSYYARLLAVRRVTQDNQGKKTAGVDGVKSLKPEQRLEFVSNLGRQTKAKALIRVWIPQPGSDEKHPLGIPTIRDRAEQALVKQALEPYWEARFEGTSYGFRPGRCAHDAIGRIYASINQGSYYVLDADITKCFDKINHDYLLSKLGCCSQHRRQIKQWLKAGVVDNGVFEDTSSGTPQGGVISPLLANIALDGMARLIEELYPRKGRAVKATLIRYADDFVVISPEIEIINQCKTALENWLKPIGLELKPEKTKICHTLRAIEVNGQKVYPGFDFLGFTIRQFPVSKHKSGKTGGGRRLIGHKTHIKPSAKAVKAHREVLKGVIKTHKTSPQATLISRLNPIIRGWSNYYSGVVSMETFGQMDYNIWLQLRAWTGSRCGKVSFKKLSNYFHKGTVKIGNGRERNEGWLFQTQDGLYLWKHTYTQITRHKLVKPEASTYDGNWSYWATRRGTSLEVPTRVAKLLKKQKGRCKRCGQDFVSEDLMEVDHIQPLSMGGKDENQNLQLLHRHCHDEKTAEDIQNVESYQ
jgi:RNA-directed DNA polymerase